MTYSQLLEGQLVLSIFSMRGWEGPNIFRYINEICFSFKKKKGSYMEMSGTMIKVNKYLKFQTKTYFLAPNPQLIL